MGRALKQINENVKHLKYDYMKLKDLIHCNGSHCRINPPDLNTFSRILRCLGNVSCTDYCFFKFLAIQVPGNVAARGADES